MSIDLSSIDLSSIDLSYLIKKDPSVVREVVTVFSGLSPVTPANVLTACGTVGAILARKNITMVCAGDAQGCQNELIEAYNSNKRDGQVIGVTISNWAQYLHPSLEASQREIYSDKTPTRNYADRKNSLKEHSTFGYVVLPGGPGTIAELWEVYGEKFETLGNGGKKNIVVVNTDGFFNPIKDQIENMSTAFGWDGYKNKVIFIDNVDDLDGILDAYLDIPAVGGSRRSAKKAKKGKKGKKAKKTMRRRHPY